MVIASGRISYESYCSFIFLLDSSLLSIWCNVNILKANIYIPPLHPPKKTIKKGLERDIGYKFEYD